MMARAEDLRGADPGGSKEPKRRGALWLLLPLALGLLVVLVLVWGGERKTWTEEVVLSDATMIKIERRSVLEKTYYELGLAGLKPNFQRIRLPDGVTFETEDRLILLHLEKGDAPLRWMLLAAPALCETFDKFNRPRPPYIQFEFDRKEWTYRAVDPKHFGKTVNLLVSDRGVSNGAHISELDKPRLNRKSRGIAPSYLMIESDKDLEKTCPRATHGGRR